MQDLDRLEIPRPCIDAQNIGFNVEWSQELTLDESLVRVRRRLGADRRRGAISSG